MRCLCIFLSGTAWHSCSRIVPGYVSMGSPLRITRSRLEVILSSSLCERKLIHLWSYCKTQLAMLCGNKRQMRMHFTSISWPANLHAAPKPTTKGVGTVPLLIPLSWPPPLNIGTTFTLGLFPRYKAPTP